MQIYANLHSAGFSVGLVGIFHKEAAILSLLYFVLVSGRHNPFSKAWEFIIRCIRALTKGDGQRVVVRNPPRPRPQAVRAGRTQNVSLAGHAAIARPWLLPLRCETGWGFHPAHRSRGCTSGSTGMKSNRTCLGSSFCCGCRALGAERNVTSWVKPQREPSAAAGGG